VLHRLEADGGEAQALAQELIDQFSADMETVLREIGVSDISIPKKVRRLAASSAGLRQSYEEVFAGGDGGFASAIAEALPRDGSVAEAAGERLAHYVKGVVRQLGNQSLSAFQKGRISGNFR
jgi:cytochrome b pre-mRNA-processing protein 3